MLTVNTDILKRFVNLLPGSFWNLVPKAPQKAIYQIGKQDQAGFEGSFPVWLYAEFDALASGDTAESALALPPDFTLLTIFGSNDQDAMPVGNLTRMQLYDLANDRAINMPPANGIMQGNSMGTKGTGLIDTEPYTFSEPEAKALIRVTNLAAAAANIQVVLRGVQGGVM